MNMNANTKIIMVKREKSLRISKFKLVVIDIIGVCLLLRVAGP